MSTSRHVIALLKSHIEGDDNLFLSVALQAAAKEARQGHTQIAQDIKALVEEARNRGQQLSSSYLREGLQELITASEPSVRLSQMVLPEATKSRLERVVLEHRQRSELFMYQLLPRRKLLLIGPPGTGKTMTARALAGDIHLSLLTVALEGVISKYMGETAAKLRLIFDAADSMPGVYFFDEFDAIGARRTNTNDVGEIRRVLNSFLQFLESDMSESLIIAATNHPDLLDPALFRRFDDVIEYSLPDRDMAKKLLINALTLFDTKRVRWPSILGDVSGMSHADINRVALDAAKIAVLDARTVLSNSDFTQALAERPNFLKGAI